MPVLVRMVEAVMRSDYRAQSETSLSLGEGETFHIMQMQVSYR